MKKQPNHPDFTYIITNETIKIIDLNMGNMSVTNGIEYVLEEIKEQNTFDNNIFNLDDYHITYQDSDGNWDGIRTKNNEFDSFYFLK